MEIIRYVSLNVIKIHKQVIYKGHWGFPGCIWNRIDLLCRVYRFVGSISAILSEQKMHTFIQGTCIFLMNCYYHSVKIIGYMAEILPIQRKSLYKQ